ncbi:MAG: histidine phosphotransferase ChpT [Methyloligellaceae bacterium]
MNLKFQLEDLDLAALISSRICHDVISPVGAISNGLEVLDEEHDEEVRDYAMDLIRRSAEQASAKLQFARLAFGAGGSAGTEIGMNTVQPIANGIVDPDKHKVIWETSLSSLFKNHVKLLLNCVAIALTTLPRGGTIEIDVSGTKERPSMTVVCDGQGARVPKSFIDINSSSSSKLLDTQSIQAYYAMRLARESNMKIDIFEQGGSIFLKLESTL